MLHQIIVRLSDGHVVAQHPAGQDVESAYPSDGYTIVLRDQVPEDWSVDPRTIEEKDDSHDAKIRGHLRPKNYHGLLFKKLAAGLQSGDTSEFEKLVEATFGP